MPSIELGAGRACLAPRGPIPKQIRPERRRTCGGNSEHNPSKIVAVQRACIHHVRAALNPTRRLPCRSAFAAPNFTPVRLDDNPTWRLEPTDILAFILTYTARRDPILINVGRG